MKKYIVVVLLNCMAMQVIGAVNGRVYVDANQNGIFDSTIDQSLAGIKVMAGTGEFTFSAADGIYYLDILQTGPNSVTAAAPSVTTCGQTAVLQISSPVSGNHGITVDSLTQVFPNLDFAYVPDGYPCGSAYGHVWLDLDSNNQWDASEPPIPGVALMVDNQLLFTNSLGRFVSPIPYGGSAIISLVNNTFDPCLPDPNLVGNGPYNQLFPANSGTHFATTAPAYPIDGDNHFGLSLSPVAGTNVDNWGRLYTLNPYRGDRPGEEFTINIDWKRFSNIDSACYIRIDFDSNYVDYIGPHVGYPGGGYSHVDTAGPGFVIMLLENINYKCMLLYFALSDSVPTDYELDWQATFFCDAPDVCYDRDTLNRTVSLPSSFKRDPGQPYLGQTFIRVYNEGAAPDGQIDANDTIFSYLYQFMNTSGDSVHYLKIVDTLPEEFRIHSITSPFSNFEYNMSMDENGVMTFEFPEVALPDSSVDYDASTVFISYFITAKQNLPEGTVINNTATAVFNRGATTQTTNVATNYIPGDTTTVTDTTVVTDTTDTTTLIWPVEPEPGFSIYPNPSTGRVIVQLTGTDAAEIKVLSAAGQLVLEKSLAESATEEIDLNAFGAGVYFIHVKGDDLNRVEKLIITE